MIGKIRVFLILIVALTICCYGDEQSPDECNITGISRTEALDINIAPYERKNVERFRPSFISELPDSDDWRPTEAIIKCMAYPNPVSLRSPAGVIIAYVLCARPDIAELRITNAACDEIFQTDLDGFADYNEFKWNLVDDTGKQVSSGIYRCFLTVQGSDGERIPQINDDKKDGISMRVVENCWRDKTFQTVYGDIQVIP